MSRQGASRDERGFTLAEVMVVIVIMGILFAIATNTWQGVSDVRRVDTATNQVAADLRLAHTQATDRLAEYRFVVTGNNTSTYQVGPTGGTLVTKTLPGGTWITAPVDIKFKADGSAVVTSGTVPIRVRSSINTINFHTIGVNAATSRVQIVL